MSSGLTSLNSYGTSAFSNFSSLFSPPVVEEPLPHATTFDEAFEREGGVKAMVLHAV
jgi:hypothetical protein